MTKYCFVFLLCLCGCAPNNDIINKPMNRTYVDEWYQAVQERHNADVPYSKVDYMITGQALCRIMGDFGVLYEYLGRDQTAHSVDFVGTEQSKEIRDKLDHIALEIQDLMDNDLERMKHE